MPKVEFLKPVDQAVGKRRLLADLRGDLLSGRYAEFDLAVAYAKSGPLLRLKADIEKWRDAGGVARAIFGIDQQGTSQEALELALKLFNEVYIAQEGGITFHPKIYNFIGEKCARVYIGSHNLTVGGTERNFEGGVALTYALPAEEEALADARDVWLQLHPSFCPSTVQLDEAALAQLIADGRVVAEKAMTHGGGGTGGPPKAKTRLILAPPSAIPAGLLPKLQKNAAQPDYPVGITGFAIQIKPHDNGEIFLSVTAALQKPEFFEFPFNGLSTTRVSGKPYPQRDPDPIVSFQVYGSEGKLLLSIPRYNLNTVYYERNSEIRVTASPLVGVVPEYSVMIMTPSDKDDFDYDIVIHTPASPEYGKWVAACNQSMPGGGKLPRKYGWF